MPERLQRRPGIETLVRFSDDFQARLIDPSRCAWMGKVVELWLDMGMLQDEASDKAIGDLAVQGLRELVERHWGGLKWVNMCFGISQNVLKALGLDWEPEYESDELIEVVKGEFGVNVEEAHLGISMWVETATICIDVKPGLQALEEEVKGLGASVLWVLEEVLGKYDCVTFSLLRYAAETGHWMGMESETEYVKEMKAYEGQDFEYEGLTKAQLEAAMPPKEWRKEIDARAVAKVAGSMEGYAGRIGRLLLELQECGPMEGMFEGVETFGHLDMGASTSFPLALCWGGDQTVEEVMDVYVRSYMETSEGCHDVSGAVALSYGNAKSIIELERKWGAASKQLKLVEEMLTILKEFEQ